MGLLRMAGRTAVVAGTATAVSGRVARRQADKYDQQAEQQQRAEQRRRLRAAADRGRQHRQAGGPRRLHDQGVLSDEEFAAAKAKILGI